MRGYRVLLALLASAVSVGASGNAAAKTLALKVTSGGDPAQIVSATYSGSSQTVSQANTINNVVYSATGSSTDDPAHLINLTLDTTSHNTTNNVRSVTFALTVTGLTGLPTIKDWQDL